MFSKAATLLACATALLISPWLTDSSQSQSLTLGSALQRVLTEIDEIAEATLQSISLETMLKPAR